MDLDPANLDPEKIGHYRLGDPAPEPEPRHINRANRALYLTAELAAAIAVGILWLRWATGRSVKCQLVNQREEWLQ